MHYRHTRCLEPPLAEKGDSRNGREGVYHLMRMFFGLKIKPSPVFTRYKPIGKTITIAIGFTDRDPWHSGNRLTRIVTTEFPHYFAVVSRVKQEVHAIGPEGGMVSSTVIPQVQAVFPQGALTKRIKVGLQVNLFKPRRNVANTCLKKISVNHVPKKKRFSLMW